MALIKDARIVADPWRGLADDEPAGVAGDSSDSRATRAVPPVRPVIVSWKRFRAEREAWVARGQPLGLRVPPEVPADAIAAELPHVALVALEFPKFTDGRAFSTARLLRERHGFTGELRAVGEVLRDQLLFMARAGFDAFELDDATARGAPRALGEITVVYQPAANGTPRRFLRRP
jgi:uncharacterized protein (DUF934 family)